MKKYQHCNLITKIWRCRWYLMMPVWFIRAKYKGGTLPSKDIWRVLLGEVDIKMNHVYDGEEIWEKIKNRQ